MNATIEVICYKSKVLNNGNHPLMLRVTKDRKTKYISLGISIPSKEWDFTKNQPKPNCSNKEHIEKIILTKKTQYNSKIIEFTANKKEYTPQILVDAVENTLAPKTIEELYCSHIKTLIKTQKIGNSQVYSYSLRSLRKFTAGKLNIPCSAITLDWLKSYEKWLKEKSCQGNTISQLFRTLRRIYSLAIEQGYASKEAYPFDKFKVSKFNTPTAKRAIEKEEILKIMAADLSDRDFYTRFSRDIFVFSYLGAGINFTDIALLKHSNIKKERIYYTRKKTGKIINFKLSEQALEIIRRYASPFYGDDDYIFPILNKTEHTTPLQIDNRIHKVIGHVNSKLKKLGKEFGIDNLTTYVARHTFVTVLKRSGVNIAIISESLGHSDLSTTQIYLDSFENDQIDEAMQNLL